MHNPHEILVPVPEHIARRAHIGEGLDECGGPSLSKVRSPGLT